MSVIVRSKTDLNDPRCRICPMLSPECLDHPCAMYGWPLAEKERSDPQLMFDTLQAAETEKLNALMRLIGGN